MTGVQTCALPISTKLHQQILQQLQRLGIEIVGGLVQHQHVRRFGEKPRQQQPIALPTGQRPDRRPRPRGLKQEILEVRDHMPRATIDGDGRVSVRHRILHAHRLIQLGPQLVEVNDLEPGTMLDHARPRGQLAEEQTQQRRLARTVGTDDPDLVAALDAHAAVRRLAVVAMTQPVALVFGNETSGLSTEQVNRCQLLAYIPTGAELGSLNLAAAVQVMAYELRLALSTAAPAEAGLELATHEELESLYAFLEEQCLASGFINPAAPTKLMDKLRRLFARTQLEREEVNILRGMVRTLRNPKLR